MKKKVLLVGYPKSGNTWLGYMLSYLLNAEYLEPGFLSNGCWYSKDSHVLNLTCGDLKDRMDTGYKSVIKTHIPPATSSKDFSVAKDFKKLTDKVVLIIREPKDVAVSYFVYQKIYIKNTRTGIGTTKHISFFNTMRKWKIHTEKSLQANPYVVRYEDLLITSANTLKNLLLYLDVEPNDDLINEALEKFKLKNLKNASDFSSKFFRKGIVGDYKNHFSKIDYLLYNLLCRDLAVRLGYT